MSPELREEIELLQEQEGRGEQVKAFLNHPAVIDVFKALELSYFMAWKETRDPAEREQLHTKASVLDELKESLLRVAQSGEYATSALEAFKRTTDQI